MSSLIREDIRTENKLRTLMWPGLLECAQVHSSRISSCCPQEGAVSILAVVSDLVEVYAQNYCAQWQNTGNDDLISIEQCRICPDKTVYKE